MNNDDKIIESLINSDEIDCVMKDYSRLDIEINATLAPQVSIKEEANTVILTESPQIKVANDKIKKQYCTTCNKMFSSRSTLNRHFKTKEHQKLGQQNSDPLLSMPEPNKVLIKTEIEPDLETTTNNDRIKTEPHKQQTDDVDNLIDCNDSKIKQTEPEDDSSVKRRTCRHCEKVFMHRPNMLAHERKHANSDFHHRAMGLDKIEKQTLLPKNSCRLCPQILVSRSALIQHMEDLHADQKTLCCPICNKSFFRQQNLKAHMLVHSDKKDHICDVCNFAFNSKSNLAVHYRIHTGVKPYICQICQRGFTQQCVLKSHMLIHTGGEDFKCRVCGATFKRRGALYIHLKRHSDIKPYECDVCLKRFRFTTELRIHSRIHTGTKDYKCDVCGKGFYKSSNLKVHLLKHSGVKPHKCEECGRGFSQAVCLRNHLQKRHKR